MIDWQNIDTVLLDMDGTLLDLHFDTHFWRDYLPRRYAFTRGLDVITAQAVLAPYFKRTAGTLDWYCLDYWSRELGLDIVALKRDLVHLIAIKDDALEFMSRLRRHGKRLVLVTNAHPKSLGMKLEHTRLDNHLDRIISAHDFGLPKEATSFWKELQEREPFTPHRTLLVDDNLAALRSARNYGIAYLLAACKPDSQQPAFNTSEFSSFQQFAEIMPTSYPSS